jgi:hypothetical protein
MTSAVEYEFEGYDRYKDLFGENIVRIQMKGTGSESNIVDHNRALAVLLMME